MTAQHPRVSCFPQGLFLKPTEGVSRTRLEPDLKNPHPQDSGPKTLRGNPNPQGTLPRQRICYLSLCILTPKLSGLKPPPFCPPSSPWLALSSSVLHPQGGSLCWAPTVEVPEVGGSKPRPRNLLSQYGSKSRDFQALHPCFSYGSWGKGIPSTLPPAVGQGESRGNKSLLFGRGWPWSKAWVKASKVNTYVDQRIFTKTCGWWFVIEVNIATSPINNMWVTNVMSLVNKLLISLCLSFLIFTMGLKMSPLYSGYEV